MNLTDLETFGVLRCLYAAAHNCHPRDVEPEDDGMDEMGKVLAQRDLYDLNQVGALLGLPPNEEMTGEHIADAITALQLEVHRARNAALRAGHRAVGGTVHHLRRPDHPLNGNSR